MLIYFGVFVKDFFVVLFFIVGIARDRLSRYGNRCGYPWPGYRVRRDREGQALALR